MQISAELLQEQSLGSSIIFILHLTITFLSVPRQWEGPLRVCIQGLFQLGMAFGIHVSFSEHRFLA